MIHPRLVSTLVGLCLAILSVTPCALAQFETRSSAPLTTEPFAFAVGDFNHDGKLDIAASSPVPNSGVSILLGNGDGTFELGGTYAVGSEAFFITAAGLRGNGILDLVVADRLSQEVYVMLGNGDGTFQAPVPYQLFGSPISDIVVSDFNGDGKLDVLVIGDVTGSETYLNVLPGNGDGTFGAAVTTLVPYGVGGLAVAAGYFNSDKVLDLAVTGVFGSAHQVDILLGNGDGTFTADSFYAVGDGPESIVVADFNGDKKTDLAIGNLTGSTISVLLGNGDGTFQQAVDYSASGPTSVAAADLDGNGIVDLVVSDAIEPAGVSVLKGNGDGTFQPAVFYPAAVESEYVAVADFNRDGKPDFVVADFADEQVITLLNTGVVTFSPTTPITLPTTLLGSTSPSRSATLTNNGTSSLTISSVKSSGPPFQMRTTCQGSIATGASCTISATFTAQVEGVTTGTVTIHDSASSKPQVVELSGTGTGVKLVPSKLTFPAQKVGTQSQPQTIQLTNVGSAPLNFTHPIFISGKNYTDFLESDNCGTQIGPGASCTISITFKPKKTGTRTAVVGIDDDGGGSPQSVPLSGTGD